MRPARRKSARPRGTADRLYGCPESNYCSSVGLVRWDSLSDHAAGPGRGPGPALPLFEAGAVSRTFDTPAFRGITFHEVRARTIINRVPAASRMPFRWTVNPYRGCSHAGEQPRYGLTVHRNGIREAAGTRLMIVRARTSWKVMPRKAGVSKVLLTAPASNSGSAGPGP